jgi:hypothetical protein
MHDLSPNSNKLIAYDGILARENGNEVPVMKDVTAVVAGTSNTVNARLNFMQRMPRIRKCRISPLWGGTEDKRGDIGEHRCLRMFMITTRRSYENPEDALLEPYDSVDVFL